MDKFMSGQKLAEQLFNLGRKPFLALALLATADGSTMPHPWGTWAGDRIVQIGDYSDDVPDFLTDAEKEEIKGSSVWNLADGFQEVTSDQQAWLSLVEENMPKVAPKDAHHLILNTQANEYLDPVKFGSSSSAADFYMDQDGVMKGLYSCLFYSTGAGGGDIKELRDGRWAGQSLKIIKSEDLPEGCTDVSKEVDEVLKACEDD